MHERPPGQVGFREQRRGGTATHAIAGTLTPTLVIRARRTDPAVERAERRIPAGLEHLAITAELGVGADLPGPAFDNRRFSAVVGARSREVRQRLAGTMVRLRVNAGLAR